MVLADSHIAAVAIVVLLMRSLDSGVRAIGPPLLPVVDFLITAVAIRGIPSGFGNFGFTYWLSQIPTFNHLLNPLISLGAACALSQWVYKLGPFRILSECRVRLAGRNHV